MNISQSFFGLLELPGTDELGETAGETAGAVGEQAFALAGDPLILAIGIVLVIITIAIVFFLKRIVINSVLGIICWAVVKYLFGVHFPLIPSLIVSVVFGPAGIGVMMLLRFLGML